MSTPRIEVDLRKIRHNTATLVGRLTQRGIGLTAVTKAVCGHPAIAQAMLQGGAAGLADSRLGNVQKLRRAGFSGPITLIRTPMLSQADQVVQFCDSSYNTEPMVITALSQAAVRQNKDHQILLMVEMGDQREGIAPDQLASMVRQVIALPGVTLAGIGANFACLSVTAPTPAQMTALSALAAETERACGVPLNTVSGGNSANLPWALTYALKGHTTGRITDLRTGEALLLGVDPVTGTQIGGLYTDAFTLVAEVIETHATPTGDGGTRVILALGRQDTDIAGLSLPVGCSLIGATSDHLVLHAQGATPPVVGAELRFQMTYSALMQAMAAPDMATILLGGRRAGPAPDIQAPCDDLAAA